ncbi:AAA family ATPase [Desulforegula conservatrix]|uniref:AAA family ATPase n=1 Tax=Desulforegula conservatrix TaxID=153026 RepID=UPI0004292672|nr:ATP-binding protein [Desulforegula conservatrix]
MKHKMVQTKDLRRFMQSIDELLNRPQGTEGMGLLWGPPGTGKTTSIAFVANMYDGVYVRALGCWTVTSMLGTLCEELKGKRKLRRSDMVNYIVHELTKDNTKPRPIFVDEADYCFRQFDMIDSLRDIYDMSGCPVILIGMENIARDIREHDRIARRITQWVEYSGLDLNDTTKVATELSDIEIAPALVQYIHKQTNGNIGRVVIALSKIEKYAEANGMNSVNADQWGDKPLYFDQPSFGKRKKQVL